MIKYDSNISTEELNARMYEILKKSLELNRNPIVREDNIPRFEEVARKLDDKLSIEYDKKIDKLFYTTSTIEEEKERLEKVVSLMGNRLEQRRELTDDFENITSKQLMGLMEIRYLDEIDYYQDRLKLINEYLENLVKIDVTNKDIDNINSDLDNEYNKKQINEENNSKLEDKLLNTFLLDINDVEISLDDDKTTKLVNYLKNANIEIELNNIVSKVNNSKSSYDTYVNSYDALKKSGALFDNENDKYFMEGVREAGKQYYAYKEQEYMLSLYKELSSKTYEYTPFIEKREKITDILSERNKLREELFINSDDYLISLPELLIEQQNDISEQKDSYSNINRLSERLKYKEDKLTKLIEDNNRVEVLSLLEEYGLVANSENVEEKEESIVDELPTFEEFMLDNPIEVKEELKIYAPNEIKDIKQSSNMNNDAINKSKDVMLKVAEMLKVAPKETTNKFIPKVDKETNFIDLDNTLILPNVEKMPDLPEVNNEKSQDIQPMITGNATSALSTMEEKEPELILPVEPSVTENTKTVQMDNITEPIVEMSNVSVKPIETPVLKEIEVPEIIKEDMPMPEVKADIPFASKGDNLIPFWTPMEEKKEDVVNSWDNNLVFPTNEEVKPFEMNPVTTPTIPIATDIPSTSGGNAPAITNNNEFTFPTFDVAEVQDTLESGNPRILKPGV